ncbi:hypothetical protein [Myxococcus sp. Y35]|uniref:hypothetical protein n=1 Tax=Pseudomyxococcus flavus TaxID=3115648 RepID=UPI003CF3EDDD
MNKPPHDIAPRPFREKAIQVVRYLALAFLIALIGGAPIFCTSDKPFHRGPNDTWYRGRR